MFKTEAQLLSELALDYTTSKEPKEQTGLL